MNAEAEGLRAAIRLKNIEIARLKKDFAFSQYNYAGALMRLADIELANAEKESRGTNQENPI